MTMIFAHRGFAGKFPENTMRAFREALVEGSDGIELDVQLSQDGQVVVIHDEKIDRTTNGKGYVKDYTATQLQAFNAGTLFSIEERIPLLTEVLEWLTTNALICNIELKNSVIAYEGMEEKVIELIRSYGLSQRVILSSFNHYSIVYCYQLAPEIEIAPLFAEGLYMPWIYAQSIRAKGYHPHYRAVPNSILIDSLKAGIEVRPYTVNREDEMKRLFEHGCSAFITDYPDRAIKIRHLWQTNKA